LMQSRNLPLTTRTVARPILAAVLLLALVVAGCVSVPFDYPKEPSEAVAASAATELGAESANWAAEHNGASGILLLLSGMDALGARLALMQGAEVSIDAQYFLLKPDAAGGIFANELLQAADRGVKVRFLLDDIFTPNLDSELALIDKHPNVEVRLFNPTSRQSAKYWSLVVDFKRANRRMHNKSFTVDNSVTIVGGRNLAAEYFQINEDVDFVDLEIIGLGPIAVDVSDTFDQFWNSALAVPIAAFGKKGDEDDLEDWRRDLEAKLATTDTIYDRALTSPYLQNVMNDIITPTAARARVVTDRPQKLKTGTGVEELQELALALTEYANNAREEIIIITPYFVPRKGGAEYLASLAAKGIRIRVVTNSLESTNHVPVHSGYARFRKRLLEAGVEFYEVRAWMRGEEPGVGIKTTLHSKAMIFDRETLFVGSLNLDPRSIDINTEMGVFLESPTIARKFAEELDQELPAAAYRAVLEDGNLRWRYEHGEYKETLKREPQSGFWRRFSSGFYGILPIEGQL
ncbi:MAG: phospholipase D family protein, partial [Gammaproteobacteria bacterium]